MSAPALVVMSILLPHLVAARAVANDINDSATSASSESLYPGQDADVSGHETSGDDLQSVFDLFIVTAAKRAQPVSESILSATVLTRDVLARSGARTIAEALRLVPGLFVIEPSPGVFEVHMRGFNNVPPSGANTEAANRMMLVMIDGRIAYSDFFGGTFWDTLPIGLEDVESIEVVRGPASAMYGPNAVAGVINIITRRPKEPGAHGAARLRGESTAKYSWWSGEQAALSGAYATEHFNARLSGHWRRSLRDVRYYLPSTAAGDPLAPIVPERFDSPDEIVGPFGRADVLDYPDPSLAHRDYAVNLFLGYDDEQAERNLRLSTGLQRSLNHTTYYDNLATPLIMSESASRYFQLEGKAFGLTATAAYNWGQQGRPDFAEGTASYRTIEGTVEYPIVLDAIRIQPGIQLRSVDYDAVLIGGARGWMQSAALLRIEGRISELTLVGAARADYYTPLSGITVPLQLGASYRLTEGHLFRLVAGRAYRGPTMFDVYYSSSYVLGGLQVYTLGSTDIELLHADSIEVGYRGRLSRNFYVDAEVYGVRLQDYSSFGQMKPEKGRTVSRKTMLDLVARQIGTVLNVGAEWPDLQASVYAAAQYTDLKGHAAAGESVNALDAPVRHKATPALFAGLRVDVTKLHPLDLHLDGYYYSDYEALHPSRRKPIPVKAKPIINLGASYRLASALTVRLSWRNALMLDRYEFPLADRIGSRVMLEVDAEL